MSNGRVMRWVPGATQGEIVAGGHGYGSGLHQLSLTANIAVDGAGAVLVADCGYAHTLAQLELPWLVPMCVFRDSAYTRKDPTAMEL